MYVPMSSTKIFAFSPFTHKIRTIMMKNGTSIKITSESVITLDGLLNVGRVETGLCTMRFECCEDVEMEPIRGDFRVQGMRDGNVYMEQKPKRLRNKALFRDDNASLSLGRDGRWHFCFSLPRERIGELPEQLGRQAGAIAQKVEEWLKVND